LARTWVFIGLAKKSGLVGLTETDAFQAKTIGMILTFLLEGGERRAK
jgi:hypothetical protein